MWTLESDGNTLENKKIWLRPGNKYLFGRTAQQQGRHAGFVINEKSVSRKHITLSVSKVKAGNGSLVDARSELTLQDEETKFGTEIDGERISGATKTLKNDKHVFVLGKTKHAFTIKWQPVVLSFSLSTKEIKGGKDPLVAMRNRLEDLDIKTIIPYLIEKTTHVVGSKRNTAKGLQALINGKHIVAESFIDALTFATTPGDLDEPESLSPLEEDFDANWPNAMDHLPPKGREPNERPKEFFKPNPERINMFEGYTFIFYDQIQFETLEAPVLNGGGKAHLFTLDPGKTTVEELLRDVKGKAGEKGLGEFEDGSVGKGVVIVRFRGKKEYQDWAIQLGDQLAIALNQRMIEQSEFMDAILENSADNFRKPLQEEDDTDFISRPQIEEKIPQEENSNQATISQPPLVRKRIRGPIQSRFKGFDDDSDEDTKSPSLRSPRDETQTQSLVNRGRSQYLTSNSVINSGREVESQESEPFSQANVSRKRPAPRSEDEDEDDLIDQMLPAAAAMKRRKIEEQEEARQNGISPETTFSKSQPKSEPEKRQKRKKELNIQEVVRERREAEDDAARRDEASLKETLDGLNVEEIKNLAVIEEMALPERLQNSRIQGNGISSSRWDEAWNGRKNFKRFRRQGEGTQARRGQSVIVPLEEVKKKDFGIGEEYWLKSDKSKKRPIDKDKGKDRSTQDTQSQLYTTARSHDEDEQEEELVPPELIINEDDYPDTIDVDAPRTTRRTDHSSHHQGDEEPRSSRSIISAKRPSGKRPAPPPEQDVARQSKKQKIINVVEDDSDSEDELKFRFRRRK